MDLYLIGHNYKYAAEQMLLSLFPDQRPVYPAGEVTGDGARIALADGEAVCTLVREGVAYTGRAPADYTGGERERVRAEQRAVKLSFYRAALSSGVPKPSPASSPASSWLGISRRAGRRRTSPGTSTWTRIGRPCVRPPPGRRWR